MALTRRRRAPLALAAAAACASPSCLRLALDPPARALLEDHVVVEAPNVWVTRDVIEGDLGESSRLTIALEIHNRDVVANDVDIASAALRVRAPSGPAAAAAAGIAAGAPPAAADDAERLSPIASGWGTAPDEPPAAGGSRAPTMHVAPGKRRSGWVTFAFPRALLGEAARPATLMLELRAAGGSRTLVLSAPAAPGSERRWLQANAMIPSLDNVVLVGPGMLGDALRLGFPFAVGRLPLQYWFGPFIGRAPDRSRWWGLEAAVYAGLPDWRSAGGRVRISPLVGVEVVIGASPHAAHPGAMGLYGPVAGLEIALGMLRPPAADVLPVAYAAPRAPLALRLAYVHWWGDLGDDPIGRRGRPGALLALASAFGP